MNQSQKFAVNARFLTRTASGVDRVAAEIISALSEREDVAHLILLHPPTSKLHTDWLDRLSPAAREKIELRQLGRFTGHLWEQISLAGAEPGLPLLSFCNTGPIKRHNQVVMIHDAQVWDAPTSFSRTFRLAYRILLPTLARRVSHVLTVSNFAKGRLEDLGIANQKKIVVVLNGASHMNRITSDPDTLVRYGLEFGRYFLAIGSVAPHKNLKRLTDAASARPDGAPDLIIVGGMNSKAFADADVKTDNGVRFIGRVGDEELKALYEGAMALAFPSLTEGFGLPPIEAMLCGCPVIATTGGAVPEICKEVAIYVDPMVTTDWSAALIRVANDPVLRTHLADKGRIHATAYTWANAAETIMRNFS